MDELMNILGILMRSRDLDGLPVGVVLLDKNRRTVERSLRISLSHEMCVEKHVNWISVLHTCICKVI